MINDPLSWMHKGGEPGEFQEDPRRPSYKLYVPKTEEEARAMTDWLCEQVCEAEDADEPRQRKILDNRKIYQGEPEEKHVMQITIAKQDANQTTAGLVNAVLQKEPMAKVLPLEAGYIQISKKAGNGEESVEEVTTVEEAQAIQKYLLYLLTRRVPFRKKFTGAMRDMVSGGMPYMKIGYEVNLRNVTEKSYNKETKKHEEVDRLVEMDEPLKLDLVDGINILMPPGESDEQLSEWFAQKYEASPTTIRRNFDSGIFYADIMDPKSTDNEELIEALVKTTHPTKIDGLKRTAARLVGRELKQRLNPLFHEIWYYWPTMKDDNLVLLHLCAHVHIESRKILGIYKAVFDHGRRPFIPFLQRPDAYEFSSGSTVEDLAVVQRMISRLYHITIKNGIQAITKAYKVKLGSPAWTSMLDLEKQGGLRPGGMVGVGDMGEVEPFQTGGSLGSLSQEISFLDQQRRDLSVLPEHKNIPNRTASGTVKQVMDESKSQGAEVLGNVREQLSMVFKMLIQTAQQFSEYGETIPFQDPKTKQILEDILYFPTELIDNQFAFEVSATADDKTVDAQKEQEVANMKLINEQSASSEERIMTILNAETPPFIEEVLKQFTLRGEKALERNLLLTNKDADVFTFDEDELDAMIEAKRAFIKKQEKEEAAKAEAEAQQGPPPQEGAPDGSIPDQGGGLPVGPMGQPPLGPPPGFEGQPGMGMPPGMPPPGLMGPPPLEEEQFIG